MHDLLLPAQAWWDAQRFDQPRWHLPEWRDQKVRHIQLHVAKALGKVVTALEAEARTVSDIDPMARVRDEVLPDVAIYRSQLLNTFPNGETQAALDSPNTSASARAAEPLWHVVLLLSRASAQLAAYIEPREHGAVIAASHIHVAIQDLHASATALAAYFAVDLAWAHRARLEALLRAPLPAAVVAGEEAGG